MTRLFDALRKSRPAAEPAHAHRPIVPPVAEPSMPGAAPRPAVATPIAPVSRAAGPLPPFARLTVAALPEAVAREMTTLRIGLESALPELSCRSVMFQSSQGGEGATTIAAQFATLLAGDARVRPLLVDLHARRPGIGARFGIDGVSAPGLGVARAGEGQGEDQTLAVLPLPESISERGYVTPNAVRALLGSVAGHFDWILFDGPPVLESAEAVELAGLVDGVVIVVEAGNTKRPVVTRAVELLRKGNAHVLGSVLNRRRLEIPDFIYRRI